MTASREAESEVGLVLVFTLGVAQCVGGGTRFCSLRSHRELSGANLIVGEEYANKDLEELVARSVEVDTESELLNLLRRGESRTWSGTYGLNCLQRREASGGSFPVQIDKLSCGAGGPRLAV